MLFSSFFRDSVLNLVEEDVVGFLVVADLPYEAIIEGIDVAVALVRPVIQGQGNDMVLGYSRLDDVAGKQVEHQIGLPTAPDARDNLDHAIALAGDKVVQLLVAPNLHTASSPLYLRSNTVFLTQASIIP